MSDVLIAPADAAQRERALDIRRSVIVQAPAGSGKTDLLTRRFLRLLAVVNEPEEIVAITFTRAATAEMRFRILSDLEAAAARRLVGAEEEPRIALARAALAQSERRGWDILNHPQRLAIETIDSLCLRIAYDRPLLAGLGGRLQPTEEAEPLHALAAHRTLERLGGPDAELNHALAHFLDLRDNRLSDCEGLLAEMLATRDQWQYVLPLSREMTEEQWEFARQQLEKPFRRENRRVLDEAYSLFRGEAVMAGELLRLANYAAAHGFREVAALSGVFAISPAMDVEHWRALCNLVFTKSDEWRKRVQVTEGFPTAKHGGAEAKRAKESMERMLLRLQQMPDLHAALRAVRELPPAAYSDEQWTTLRHILTVLRRAIAELRVVFAENNAVDFTEVSLAAPEVLRDSPERLGGISAATHHLLIDEFQDTSRRQHELVEALITAWDLSEHRTCFLVGDPMQSIYMFRQAEVEIFGDVRERGIGPDDNRVVCDPVQLSVSFRSHSGLTEPLNQYFAEVFGESAVPGSAAVPFAPAIAADETQRDRAVHVHAQIIGEVDRRPSREEYLSAREQEAEEALRILERHLPRIEQARARGEEYRVAVLVRARPHLAEIVPLLRRNGIAFRAVEIEHLAERQELLDLRSLTRALLHPMDRIAWLSVLRAPWCGLTLSDLHVLTGADDRDFRAWSVPELIDRRQHLLSPDGQQRLGRTAATLRAALETRWTDCGSFAGWIERTWRTLGGAACLDAAALENTQVFFSLLDGVAPDGLAPLTPEFDAELNRLFAHPDPMVSERCGIQLMTIHKAKGLGFDVVIVPGLDRASSSDAATLLCALDRRNPWTPAEDEFLVAPIGPRGDESDPLYQWVTRQRKIRFDEERKRLFYVACTRARSELHLLGTATLNGTGFKPGEASSLLETAWPALQGEFEALLQALKSRPAVQKVLEFPSPGMLEELAAVAALPPGPKRLPIGFEVQGSAENVVATVPLLRASAEMQEFRRPEGGRRSRIVGSAVHALLQRLGPGLATLSANALRAHAAVLLRSVGLNGESQNSALAAVLGTLQGCAADPVCQWILANHPEAQSEASWSGYGPGSRLRTLRADRVFRAGAEPYVPGTDCFWIIDYKTGTPGSVESRQWLERERDRYAPQLVAYGRALRALHGADVPLRLGLYYPAIAVLDWWDPGA